MADWRDEVLLEGDFYMTTKKRTLFKVTLTPLGLFYSQITTVSAQYEEKSLQISDVIGCHCSSPALLSASPNRTNGNIACFTVFAYPFRKKMFSGKQTRHRQTVTFEVSCCSTLEENKRIANKWKNVINCLARGIHVKPSDVERCEPPPRGKFLVLVNPHSGPGKALQIFKNEVEPMLEEAGIPFKLVITDDQMQNNYVATWSGCHCRVDIEEYAGHAHDLMQNLELAEWGAVVIVSGDGLIYEVINGLMQRVDWTSAIKKPVGCVPGGSGNALACSINYAAGEPVLLNPVLHSTFVLVKHRVVPMDLVFVQTPSKQYFSFLSMTWGMVADIDYESEKYRNLGEARFTLGAIKRIVNLRAYSGKISFLPVAEYVPKTAMTPKVLKKVRRFSLRSMSSSLSSVDSLDSRSSVVLTAARSMNDTPSSTDKMQSLTGFPNGGGDANIAAAEQDGSETDTLSPVKQAQDHNSVDIGEGDFASNSKHNSNNTSSSAAEVEVSSSVENSCSTTFKAQQSHSSSVSGAASLNNVLANGTTANLSTSKQESSQHKTISSIPAADHADFEEETLYADKKDGQAVPTPLLSPLDQPVPDNWVVVQGRFVLCCAVYQTHLGSDMLAAPSARLADGVIHLMFVRDGISRNQLLNLFLTFSEGMHVDSPEVEFVPVLAFRLEPDQNSGNIMIDGERLDPVPIQGQVLPSLARVMAIQ